MQKKIRFIIILWSSFISSLGTYPYAKNFSQTLFSQQQVILIFSVLFVLTAVPCNIILSIQSLISSINLLKLRKFSKQLPVFIICIISASANGFICFTGYSSILPSNFNFIISSLVTLVNAGISYSAISNLIPEIKIILLNIWNLIRAKKIYPIFLISTFIFSAILGSLTTYLASFHTLLTVFHHSLLAKHLSTIYIISTIIWLPWAALFLNASYKIFQQLSLKFKNLDQRTYFSRNNIIIGLFALFSGSAYAEMAYEFFDCNKNIPDFFKYFASHNTLLMTIIVPVAFIMSSLVNAHSLNKLSSKQSH